jgi:hypothetical protein
MQMILNSQKPLTQKASRDKSMILTVLKSVSEVITFFVSTGSAGLTDDDIMRIEYLRLKHVNLI